MRHINRHPTRGMRLTLVLLPFVILLAAYFLGSAVRLEANPQDKLLPGMQQMLDAMSRMAFTPDKRSGDYLFWMDTLVSLARLLTGLAIASLIGLCLGITAGVFPMWRCSLSRQRPSPQRQGWGIAFFWCAAIWRWTSSSPTWCG